NERAVLLEELVHQLLVPVVHERLDRRSDGLEIGRGREVLPKPVRNADTDPNDPAEQDHQDREQTFRDASPAWTHDEDLVVGAVLAAEGRLGAVSEPVKRQFRRPFSGAALPRAFQTSQAAAPAPPNTRAPTFCCRCTS